MEQPQRFVHRGGEHLVCKLHNIEVLKNNRIRGEIAQSQAHKTHKYVNNAWSEMSNSPPALLFIPFHVPLH
jgi:hypothetical protein